MDIEETLRNHEQRLRKLESEISDKSPRKADVNIKGGSSFKGISGGINLLLRQNFFKEEKRSLAEIYKALQSEGYSGSLATVAKALARNFVNTRKVLRRDKVGAIYKYFLRNM